MQKKHKVIGILLAIVMVIIDQFSKVMVVYWLPRQPKFIDIVPGIIDFRYVENYGAAFGLFSDMRWVFMIPTTIVLIVCLYIYFFKKVNSLLVNYALMLIISGGIGNMIDRVFRGYVIDFINFSFVNFYVFNIADSCVVIGGCLFFIYMIIDFLKENKQRKNGEKIA